MWPFGSRTPRLTLVVTRTEVLKKSTTLVCTLSVRGLARPKLSDNGLAWVLVCLGFGDIGGTGTCRGTRSRCDRYQQYVREAETRRTLSDCLFRRGGREYPGWYAHLWGDASGFKGQAGHGGACVCGGGGMGWWKGELNCDPHVDGRILPRWLQICHTSRCATPRCHTSNVARGCDLKPPIHPPLLLLTRRTLCAL